MKMIWVRYMMDYGMFLMINMPEAQAKVLIDKWAKGDLQERSFSGICFSTGVTWAVLQSAVIGIHTVTEEQMSAGQQQAQQQQKQPFQYVKSGG